MLTRFRALELANKWCDFRLSAAASSPDGSVGVNADVDFAANAKDIEQMQNSLSRQVAASEIVPQAPVKAELFHACLYHGRMDRCSSSL